MRDRALIKDLRRSGAPIRGIARELGASRNAVRAAIAPGAPERYERASQLWDVEPAVREILARYPLMSGPSMATLVDWPGSVRQLNRLLAEIRDEYLARVAAARIDLVRPAAGRVSADRPTMGRMTLGRLTDDRTGAPA